MMQSEAERGRASLPRIEVNLPFSEVNLLHPEPDFPLTLMKILCQKF
jgi:hypothetical protein